MNQVNILIISHDAAVCSHNTGFRVLEDSSCTSVIIREFWKVNTNKKGKSGCQKTTKEVNREVSEQRKLDKMIIKKAELGQLSNDFSIHY